MTYTLELNLVGAEKVQSILSALQSSMKTISTSSPLSKELTDSAKGVETSLKRAVSNFKQSLNKMRDDWRETMKDIIPKVSLIEGRRGRPRGSQNTFDTGDLTNTGAGLATDVPAELTGTQRVAKLSAAQRRRNRIERIREIQNKKDQRDDAAFFKDLSFAIQPLANPLSPWGTTFALRQFFSAGMTEKGQGLLGKIGLSGVSGAAIGAGGLTAILTAVGLALKGFQRIIEAAKQSVSELYKIYTQAAQTGVTPTFYAYRQTLANIFGVQGNPNQVFMFGKAVKDVSERISQATNILGQDSPKLAQTAINLKVLGVDFEAFAADVATKLTPAINIFLAAMDVLVKKMMGWVDKLALAAVILGRTELMDALSTLNSNTFKTFQQFLKPLPSSLPLLMKQLPGSAWEHQGLSIGPSLGNEVVNQIKKSNSYLKHLPMIATALGANNGVPRSSNFGLNPMVNNP